MRNPLCIAFAVVALSACSSSSDGGETGQPSSSAANPAACDADCDRQAAAGCAVGVDAASCKQICAGNRGKVAASCQAAFDAIYSCASAKVSYSCDAKGLTAVTPVGACAAEANACAKCNGGQLCFGF